MAGSTNNYHFIKPADDEAADNTPLNTNFDNIDAALGAHDDALAIVSDGNTHAAIAAGQFVYVRNHGTLANGLYTANSNIAANATLSSSNLTADSYGGLNALNANIASHNSQITGSNNWSFNHNVYKAGNVVSFSGYAINNTEIATNSWVNIGTLPEGYRPPNNEYYTVGYDNTNDSIINVRVQLNGTIAAYSKTASKVICFNLTFVV